MEAFATVWWTCNGSFEKALHLRFFCLFFTQTVSLNSGLQTQFSALTEPVEVHGRVLGSVLLASFSKDGPVTELIQLVLVVVGALDHADFDTCRFKPTRVVTANVPRVAREVPRDLKKPPREDSQ